jgi:hypothetical protein
MLKQASTLRIRGYAQPAEQQASLGIFQLLGRLLTGISATVVPSATSTSADPFAAVAHEHHVLNGPVILREDDSESKPIPQVSSNERYRGPRGRLLTFKKKG